MSDIVEVRRGAYHDSVSLMQASRVVQDVPGVQAALVAMATDLNVELAAGLGFLVPDEAGPNDLLVAVRVGDDEAGPRALAALDGALRTHGAAQGSADDEQPPRTTRSAAARVGANLALVSVPGRHAFVEAMDALEAGCSVMVFSDGVALGQEIRLKDEAEARGLLVMGPDCGTAIVGGVGLGFANAVRPGPVGIVAASGTGAQQLCCLLDAAGVGISHVLGVGGRDLSADVAGRSTVRALRALDADPATELVVVVSKPPAAAAARRVEELARTLATPVVFGLLGAGRPDLTEVAVEVTRRLGSAERPAWPEWPTPRSVDRRRGALRGLFCGGTLCDEAMVIASTRLGRIGSNIPLQPDWALPGDLRATGHAMIDFGEDALTAGRPHPMIDPTLRIERLFAEARDPDTAVLLLDVVLGYAAHPDPAADLVPALETARSTAGADGRDLAFVVSLCGTASDPQGRDRQAAALQQAGAHVFASNAAAARHAVSLAAGS